MAEQEKMHTETDYEEGLRRELDRCSCLLVGLGAEWRGERLEKAEEAYLSLYRLLTGRDYFVVTTVTDGLIWDGPLDKGRICAPCGNVRQLQCSRACTPQLWQAGERQEGSCPHCGAPLAANTADCGCYVEEGYLPQWQAYQKWLSGTLNRELLILELGEGMKRPEILRWPLEKTVFFNKKAHMFRVNETLPQIPAEIRERAWPVRENSPDFVKKCAHF